MTVEAWNMETGALFVTETENHTSLTAPPSGGYLHVGNLKSDIDGAAQDFIVCYAWDRALSDENIQDLVRDPFGLIRPDPLRVMVNAFVLPFHPFALPVKPGQW
jgi:hypothetical protein